ncbi:uncharacterized protein LOC114253904 isoform X3 [Monomorium pharaonis]|uniref:uncharacterized protein LOC114253904 isoform X3 n=1 Tax=Monomorium pharaonis TaxID=307658 RepID=UPI001746D843|nr:uncharacterized protein LOC114253904 isoform X3 [Monomorium pharaonis]
MSLVRRGQHWGTFARIWHIYNAKWQDPYKSAEVIKYYLMGLYKPIYHPLNMLIGIKVWAHRRMRQNGNPVFSEELSDLIYQGFNAQFEQVFARSMDDLAVFSSDSPPARTYTIYTTIKSFFFFWKFLRARKTIEQGICILSTT